MASSDVEKWYQAAVDVAKEAGVIIRDGFYKAKKVEMKGNPRDLVTETDKAVEDMVMATLHKTFPDHKFIGEESVAAGAKCELTDAPTWIIDPVDGTMNFVHSFPYTCISIGLWVDKEARVAVVFNPILDQLYTAKKGEGAYLNGQPIKVSGQKELSKSLVMTELWCRPDEKKMKIAYSNAMKVISQSHGPRCMGSAALNMCQVAQGGADGYYEIGLHAWDVAAGKLIVEEAGGVVTDITGAPIDIMNRRLLCVSSPELGKALTDILEIYEEERD
uniref:Inositol-1-monophosphatase n=1 Tax=Hirondellea gigas TaxID=1518452 RepID=A0A6A7G1E7_9CRUS